ncbi:MAG: hypothetical protein R3Y44_04895 [Rikenellaceae bacterium]
MERKRQSNLVISTMIVALLAFAAIMLLLSAFVIWFADLINSLPLALAITGSALAIASWTTYKVNLLPTLKLLRQEYEQAMVIITLIKSGYDFATRLITQLTRLIR